MKKILKGTALIILAMVMTLSNAACVVNDDSPYAKRPNKVTVQLFKGGYGEDWLKDVAKLYMDTVNTDTYIHVTSTVMNAEEGDKVAAGLSTQDIYFLEYEFRPEHPLEDLSGIVKGKPTGETDYTIEEKMGEFAGMFSHEGVYKQMPYGGAGTYAYSYACNKTTLDEALGKDKWSLPRTTKEFFEMGAKLKEKNVYLTAASYGDHTAYMPRGLQVWFAQVAGAEAYTNYMNGKYWDGTEWTMPESAPLMINQQKDAIKAMYNTVTTIARKDNAYLHVDSLAMEYMNVEAAFSGYGFGLNSKKVAFLFNGPWLNNEIAFLTEALAEDGRPQELVWMKIPLASELVGAKDVNGNLRLTTVTTEEKLRDCVSYIDGDVSEKPAGVSDSDLAVIRESRSMYPTLISGSAVVPKRAKNKDGAKEFLKFIASDAAIAKSAESLDGLHMLPYTAKGNPVTTESQDGWAKSYQDATKEVIAIDNLLRDFGLNSFSKKTGFRPYSSDYLEYAILTTQQNSIMTPDQYFDSVYSQYNGRWSQMITQWKA